MPDKPVVPTSTSCSQIRSPVAASSACTTGPMLARYITPSWTIGEGAFHPPSFIAQIQASSSSPALFRSMSSRGL